MPRLRPRSLWRNTAVIGPEEIRRTERWLATARVSLAIAALVAVWIDPAEIRSVWAYALLAIYIGQGTAIIVLLRSSRETRTSFLGVVHAADVVFPALISLCTSSHSNSFFLFFLFVIAAAAYRWGLWETLITSISAVWLLWLETWALWDGGLQIANAWFSRHHLPLVNANLEDFDPKRLLMRSVYLVVMGLLLGYLAEQQKKLRAERDERVKMLGLVSMENGLAATLSEVIGELLRMYRASRAILAAREGASQRLSVGTFELRKGSAELQWIEPGPFGADSYLSNSDASSCYARMFAGDPEPQVETIGVTADGGHIAHMDDSFLRKFAVLHAFDHLIAISFSFGLELEGRVFLLEPEIGSSAEEELRFLQDLVRQVGPAIYNVYLLRRLRKRAGALERARLVRELHDGAVQSLIGVEMQVDVLRRSCPVEQNVSGELERIQQLLREEVLKLRDLMQQMKSADIDARKLPGFLRDTVQRFQRETGIAARFLMDDEELVLSQPVCREVARIAQEALVNVRKHSGAKEVLVQLVQSQGDWELIIEDDGAGFPFTGRVSQAELESTNRGPAIIRERVKLIPGELTIESRPGRGARVEIRIPPRQSAAHG